ncbi:MAG: hypothetical protein HOC77_05985 [Chloroflexi bacterium]|nr:hypothetical protein [Chloroflexota bacterium]MBT4514624.1 hypothetical protein [Chloroflexota bacterium]MBT6681104.1 hypothetical protein [Chloroflexota bacterium]
MTKTVEAGGDVTVDSGLVTKWFSVRAVEGDGADLSPDVDGGHEKIEDGPLTLIASTSQEDRAGDVVSASGWDLTAYKANPVFLWAHDYRRPAIGKCVKVWVQDASDGGRLMASIEFAPTPFAQEIRSLYAAGFMRGVSVGFRAIEMEPRTGSSGRRGVLFKRQELLEISAAPVPVNAGALVRAGVSEDAGVPAISEPADSPEIRGVRDEIREFWGVLADLTGGERKSVEADSVGEN